MTRKITYICQFCKKEFFMIDWKANQDKCPGCHRAYNPMLAQEGDD